MEGVEAVVRRGSIKEVLSRSLYNSQVLESLLIQLQAQACNFITNKTSAQLFFCEFHKISKKISGRLLLKFWK